MDYWNFIEHLRLLGVICWILKNRVVTSQLLTFEGQFIHVKGGEILMLTCSCTYVPEECTMEFLHNNATAEILRKTDNVCYSTDKLCNPRECSCNEDCKSYSWNLTSSSVKKDDSFGCGMRVENTTYNTKIYLTLKYNGSDFISPTTVIVSENEVSTTLHYTQTTSAANNGNTNNNLIQNRSSYLTKSANLETDLQLNVKLAIVISSIIGGIIAAFVISCAVTICVTKYRTGGKYKTLQRAKHTDISSV